MLGLCHDLIIFAIISHSTKSFGTGLAPGLAVMFHFPADAHVRVTLHAFEGRAGQPLWIVTTLALESSAVAQLDEQRAEIETDIRQWNSFLKLDELRGRSAEMILKELVIGCVTYNLVVPVRRLAAPADQLHRGVKLADADDAEPARPDAGGLAA